MYTRTTFTVIGGPKHGQRIALPYSPSRYVEFPRYDGSAFLPYAAECPPYCTIKTDRYEVRRVELFGVHVADLLVHETVGAAPRVSIR